MKQKTKIALNAFGCGSYCATLISSIAHGNVAIGLVVLALLIIQGIFFIQEYSND
ncbi:hypothetical protein [Undibacterium sp. Di24W]|uniref:hypothetical protein n=1 Tax=Undibacterium sp. Di24W TaxID=3413033 RepID=UPI003BF11661